MSKALYALPLLFVASLTGCMQIKGVVVNEVTGRPIPSAVVSIGRPDGPVIYNQHRVNGDGEFDFKIALLDTTNIWVFDSAAAPSLTMLRVPEEQLGTKMKVRLRPPPRREPEMIVPR